MAFHERRMRISGGIAADEEYWAALQDGVFKLPRCAKCGNWTWPAHFRCGPCGSWDFKWEALEPVGTVYTWARAYYSFEDVRERGGTLPYVTVLAEIPAANNARVMGVLQGDDKKLKIGAPVRGVILPPSELSKWYPSIVWTLA